jgi:uncharacterized protein (UPF0297 family)
MAINLENSFYTFGIYLVFKEGKYSFEDYATDYTVTNINTGNEINKTDETIADALDYKLGQYVRRSGAGASGYEIKFDNRSTSEERRFIFFDLNFVRSKMELPPGTVDTTQDTYGKVIPGPPISPSYPKAYDILTSIENIIKEILSTAYVTKDEDVWKKRENIKDGLPIPMTYEITSENNPVVNTWSSGDGGWKIVIKVNNTPNEPKESYLPDTTPFRRRGLVKIQGEEQYREVSQIIGKDLSANPTTVSSDNQTHVSASETDEQVENSIAVSVWYFKNKTTGNINTFENRSKIPKEKYTSEYERLKIILGLV